MSMNVPPMVTLCVVLLVYIPLGMFLDALSMLIITIPLVFPIITGFGYDGIWLGILLVKMMEIGYVTPPLGFNVFIIHGTNPDVPIERIFGQCLRFIAADVAVLLLCLVFPILVTFFPRLVG